MKHILEQLVYPLVMNLRPERSGSLLVPVAILGSVVAEMREKFLIPVEFRVRCSKC